MITTNTAIITADNQSDLSSPSSYCYLFDFIAAANSQHLAPISVAQLCFATTVSWFFVLLFLSFFKHNYILHWSKGDYPLFHCLWLNFIELDLQPTTPQPNLTLHAFIWNLSPDMDASCNSFFFYYNESSFLVSFLLPSSTCSEFHFQSFCFFLFLDHYIGVPTKYGVSNCVLGPPTATRTPSKFCPLKQEPSTSLPSSLQTVGYF